MARDFDGSADIIKAMSSFTVAASTGFAVGSVFKTDGTLPASSESLIGVLDSPYQITMRAGFNASFGDEGFLFFQDALSANANVAFASAVDDGAWHAAVGGRTAAGVAFVSVSGGNTATGSTLATELVFTIPMGIGADSRAVDGVFFDGKIANTFFANNVDLSSAQAQALSALLLRRYLVNGDLGLDITDGFNLWLEGLDSPEPDMSGLKNNGTLTSAPPRANGPPLAPYSARFWGHGPLVEAAGGIDYTLAADAGAFVLAGIAAGLIKGYVLPADAGAHAMAGTSASLILGRKIAADGGAFAMAGQDAALTWAASLGAVAGSFSLSGQDADLVLGYVLAAIGGAYDLAGQDAGLVTGHGIAADGGVFSLAGSAAGLSLGRTVAADAGAFDMVGADAGLRWAAKLVAEAGAYTFAGQDADLLHAVLALAAVLFPPNIVDASPRRWKVDAERIWEIDAPARRFKVDDDL